MTLTEVVQLGMGSKIQKSAAMTNMAMTRISIGLNWIPHEAKGRKKTTPAAARLIAALSSLFWVSLMNNSW